MHLANHHLRSDIRASRAFDRLPITPTITVHDLRRSMQRRYRLRAFAIHLATFGSLVAFGGVVAGVVLAALHL